MPRDDTLDTEAQERAIEAGEHLHYQRADQRDHGGAMADRAEDRETTRFDQ